MPTDLKKMIKSLLGGLIEVVQERYRISSTDKKDDHRTREIAQFIHQSVRDYVNKGDHLHGLGDVSENDASFEGRSYDCLARTCIHYLSLLIRGLPTREVAITAKARRTLFRQDLRDGVVPATGVRSPFYIDVGEDDFLPNSIPRLVDQTFFDHAYPFWRYYAGMAEKEDINCAITPKDLQQPLQDLEPFFPTLSDMRRTKQFGIYKVVTNGLAILLKAFLQADGAYSKLISLAEGYYDLTIAAKEGHKDVAKVLLDFMGENKSHAIEEALNAAIEKGRTEIATMLLDQVECNPDACSQPQPSIRERRLDGHTSGPRPLVQAIECSRTEIVGKLLSNDRVGPNLTKVDDVAPLAGAAAVGSIEIVRLLVTKAHHGIDLQKHRGRSLLSFETEGGSTEVMRLCLQIDKSPRDLPDNEGRTPLHWAASADRAGAATLLLEIRDLDTDRPDRNGQTPLSIAAKLRHIDVIRVLMKSKRMDIDHKDLEGRTPLSLAAHSREFNADINHQNAAAVVKLLLDSMSVDAESIDSKGWSPLCYAVEEGNLEAVILLVESGKVDVNLNTMPDNDFHAQVGPLTIADRINVGGREWVDPVQNKKIVEFLKSHGAYKFPPPQLPSKK